MSEHYIFLNIIYKWTLCIAEHYTAEYDVEQLFQGHTKLDRSYCVCVYVCVCVCVCVLN